jgi:hypothetical protein
MTAETTDPKAAVTEIIRRIVHDDPEYVLDGKYVRWGKVERDLWALVSRATPQDGPVVTLRCDERTSEIDVLGMGDIDPAALGLAPGACQRFRLAPIPEGEPK